MVRLHSRISRFQFLILFAALMAALSTSGSAVAQVPIVGSGMTPDQRAFTYTNQVQSAAFKFWLQVPIASIMNRYGTQDYNFNARVYRPDGREVWNTVYGFNQQGYCEVEFWLPSLFRERSASQSSPSYGMWTVRLAVIHKDTKRDTAVKDFQISFLDGSSPSQPPVTPGGGTTPPTGGTTFPTGGITPPPPYQGGNVVYLSDLRESGSGNIHGGLGKDRPYWQGDLILANQSFSKGIITHPMAENGRIAFVEYSLNGQYSTFRATLGSAQDHGSYGKGTMNYRVLVDGRAVDCGPFPVPPGIREISVDVRGARMLRLEVDNGYDGNNSDHAAWGNARLER